MSELIERSEVAQEFPKKGQSGSGTAIGYSVEARHTARDHAVIGGIVYTDKWKRVHPDKTAFGVPSHSSFDRWLEQCSLMNYQAAQAIRWWFHAIAFDLLLVSFGALFGAIVILLTHEPKGITKAQREPKRYVYNDQALNRKYRDAPGRREVPNGTDGVQYRFMGMGTMDEE
jgi:hypothetical protein